MNQELIDKHRDINVDGDWWYEGVYEWFEEECKARGVAIASRQQNNYRTGKVTYEPEIAWSGFWSQGDGAAFGGYIEDVAKALGDYNEDFPLLEKYIVELGGHFSFSWGLGRGNYIRFASVEYEPMSYYADDHPLVELWEGDFAIEVEKAEIHFRDLADDLCDLLYKALRDEYEALTSDEAVWDTIVANELNKEIA